MNSKTLIHTALFCEAKPIIEYFKMQCLQKKPYRIYNKNDILLIVSGIGAKNSLHVKDIFEKNHIKKAVNIGIAGCKEESVPIGTLFCTNQRLEGIEYATLCTVDEPLDNKDKLETMLVDMEAKSFLHVSEQFLGDENIFVFKVVSDYLDKTIPSKEFVENLIKNSIKSWERYIEK
jgi:nucleoside phosphorylase